MRTSASIMLCAFCYLPTVFFSTDLRMTLATGIFAMLVALGLIAREISGGKK